MDLNLEINIADQFFQKPWNKPLNFVLFLYIYIATKWRISSSCLPTIGYSRSSTNSKG